MFEQPKCRVASQLDILMTTTMQVVTSRACLSMSQMAGTGPLWCDKVSRLAGCGATVCRNLVDMQRCAIEKGFVLPNGIREVKTGDPSPS